MKACESIGLNERITNSLLDSLPRTRSTLQNASLHLFCKMVADGLNEQGQTWKYEHIITGKIVEVPFSMYLVKDYIWRPIQITLFDKTTTTKLTTSEINQIVDVINLHLGENFGLSFVWPSKETKCKH